ncbi:SGNH/GDSL hydrolase family protein [Gammaproteobacteria bacterium]|nr:SGNH/GDSL hydrolase family protein [Gammaproteobacteria bacterium]
MPLKALQAVSIITIGDSVTSGYKRNAKRNRITCAATGETRSYTFTCHGNGVVNRGGFQPALRAKLAVLGYDATIYNWGFAGYESWNVASTVNSVMSAQPAEYVFIMAGLNDMNDNVSTSTTYLSLVQTIERVQAQGLVPIVNTITPHGYVPSYNVKIAEINELIKQYGANNNVPVGDPFPTLRANWSYYNSGDLLHLSSAGDEVVAEQFAAAFEQWNSQNDDVILMILPLLLRRAD